MVLHALTLVLLSVATTVAADEVACEYKDLGDWQPWDDGDNAVSLLAVVAVDEREGCATAAAIDAAFFHVEDAIIDRAANGRGRAFVALNGANSGVYLPYTVGCLGSLALAAARALGASTLDQRLPLRFLSNTGRPVRRHEDARRSDFILHLMLDQEVWVWPGIRVGFAWKLAGATLETISLEPRVILVRDALGDEQCKELIDKGGGKLARSPEKHCK